MTTDLATLIQAHSTGTAAAWVRLIDAGRTTPAPSPRLTLVPEVEAS